MASFGAVTVKIVFKVSLWDAIKIRIAGEKANELVGVVVENLRESEQANG